MKKDEGLSKEAHLIGTYLLNKNLDEKVIKLYVQAMQATDFSYLPKDRKILRLLSKRGFLLPYIDAGLAILFPNSVIRQKILIMTAIIETQPQYSHLFLNKKRNFFYLFIIGWVGMRSILKAILGVLLVKVL